jgi:short-subunit dehydrogenase
MVAVITGATQGIGKATAIRFAKEKFDLIITARNTDDLQKVRSELEKEFSIKVFTSSADFTKLEEAKKFSEFVKSNTVKIDVLVNNVGQYMVGDLFENSAEKFQEQINVNLLSAHVLTEALMPVFKSQKKGHIFTIGSLLSFKLRESAAFYTITKHAIRTWNQLLFEYVREFGVKATLVMPSSTLTASWGDQPKKEEFIQPADIADSIYNCFQLPGASVVDEISVRTITKNLEG